MALTFKGLSFGDDLEIFHLKIHQAIRKAFIRAGEQFITDCREQPGSHDLGFYEDVTGNLRNSIGYYLYFDGELIERSPVKVDDMADVAVMVEPTGYHLIGFAGMNYASHVESKGYNVITAQKEVLFINLTNYFKDIQKFINDNL